MCDLVHLMLCLVDNSVRVHSMLFSEDSSVAVCDIVHLMLSSVDSSVRVVHSMLSSVDSSV